MQSQVDWEEIHLDDDVEDDKHHRKPLSTILNILKENKPWTDGKNATIRLA